MILALMAAPELSRVISGLVSGMKGAPTRDSSLSDGEIPAMARRRVHDAKVRLLQFRRLERVTERIKRARKGPEVR